MVNSTIKIVFHLIVVPQLSSGWEHNYSTKTRQVGCINEQSMSLLCLRAHSLAMKKMKFSEYKSLTPVGEIMTLYKTNHHKKFKSNFVNSRSGIIFTIYFLRNLRMGERLFVSFCLGLYTKMTTLGCLTIIKNK